MEEKYLFKYSLRENAIKPHKTKIFQQEKKS